MNYGQTFFFFHSSEMPREHDLSETPFFSSLLRPGPLVLFWPHLLVLPPL
jgi:hypothetical protein